MLSRVNVRKNLIGGVPLFASSGAAQLFSVTIATASGASSSTFVSISSVTLLTKGRT